MTAISVKQRSNKFETDITPTMADIFSRHCPVPGGCPEIPDNQSFVQFAFQNGSAVPAETVQIAAADCLFGGAAVDAFA